MFVYLAYQRLFADVQNDWLLGNKTECIRTSTVRIRIGMETVVFYYETI